MASLMQAIAGLKIGRIFRLKIKSADFRIVSGLNVRPFFGILADFFIGKKNRPIFNPSMACISIAKEQS
ncbi:unnamed protein product [Staurois parvus]|uniref:Ribosomal protein L14 n=1 Tax=Staurois parvus TaxID=386267 RepID=A0ABN9E4X3_9NEOB|nr:unnamed protein product [Staurois parvus]